MKSNETKDSLILSYKREKERLVPMGILVEKTIYDRLKVACRRSGVPMTKIITRLLALELDRFDKQSIEKSLK